MSKEYPGLIETDKEIIEWMETAAAVAGKPIHPSATDRTAPIYPKRLTIEEHEKYPMPSGPHGAKRAILEADNFLSCVEDYAIPFQWILSTTCKVLSEELGFKLTMRVRCKVVHNMGPMNIQLIASGGIHPEKSVYSITLEYDPEEESDRYFYGRAIGTLLAGVMSTGLRSIVRNAYGLPDDTVSL